MNRNTAILVSAMALLAGGAAAQQARNFDAVQVKTTDLGNKTWMLAGEGGNITVVAGADGVIMVDTEYLPLHDRIKAAVAQVSDQPIKYVINTHYHGDHTGGNQGFWLDGATVVATVDLKHDMAEGVTNAITGAKSAPMPAAALPKVTYTGSTTVAVKGRSVKLIAMANAHTGGDTGVWVADANVLATGDIVSMGPRYPNIDIGSGGDIDGIVAALDRFIARANAKTKVVPGHGPLTDKAGLVVYRKLIADARDAVRKVKASGMTEDQAVAAKPLAGDIQGRARASDMASDIFVRTIYRTVG